MTEPPLDPDTTRRLVDAIDDLVRESFTTTEAVLAPSPRPVTWDDLIALMHSFDEIPRVIEPVELTSAQVEALKAASPEPYGVPMGGQLNPLFGVRVKIVDPVPPARRRWWHRFTRRPQ